MLDTLVHHLYELGIVAQLFRAQLGLYPPHPPSSQTDTSPSNPPPFSSPPPRPPLIVPYPLPQPLTQLHPPSRSILIHPKLHRHTLISIRQLGPRPLALNLSQRSKIAAYSKDNSARPWKRGQGVVFDA